MSPTGKPLLESLCIASAIAPKETCANFGSRRSLLLHSARLRTPNMRGGAVHISSASPRHSKSAAPCCSRRGFRVPRERPMVTFISAHPVLRNATSESQAIAPHCLFNLRQPPRSLQRGQPSPARASYGYIPSIVPATKKRGNASFAALRAAGASIPAVYCSVPNARIASSTVIVWFVTCAPARRTCLSGASASPRSYI